MDSEDAEEWTQTLGGILGCSWRQIALAHKLGVPQALDMSLDQWVTQRLGGYVKQQPEERREAVGELAADGLTQREIAAVVGASPMTVNRDLYQMGQAATSEQGEPTQPVTNDTEPLPPVKDRTPSCFAKAAREVNRIQTAIHKVVDEFAEGFDRPQAAEIILGLESIREQVQFALITLGDRLDND